MVKKTRGFNRLIKFLNDLMAEKNDKKKWPDYPWAIRQDIGNYLCLSDLDGKHYLDELIFSLRSRKLYSVDNNNKGNCFDEKLIIEFLEKSGGKSNANNIAGKM